MKDSSKPLKRSSKSNPKGSSKNTTPLSKKPLKRSSKSNLKSSPKKATPLSKKPVKRSSKSNPKSSSKNTTPLSKKPVKRSSKSNPKSSSKKTTPLSKKPVKRSSKSSNPKSSSKNTTSSSKKPLKRSSKSKPKSSSKNITPSSKKPLKRSSKSAPLSKNKLPLQTKLPKTLSLGGFFHTTKGKIISVIVGLLVLGGVGAGIGIGLSSGNSSSEDTTDESRNLNDVQERNLQEKLDQLNDDYKDALIAFIISKNSLKTRADLINKDFDDLKKEVFNIFENKLSSETESFDDLLIALQSVTLETWTAALDQLDSNQSLATIIVSSSFVEVDNQPLTSQLMEQFDLVDKLPKLTGDISIKYSHPALDQNGELLLTLNVTIGRSNSINKELLFTIQGLDLKNAKDDISRLEPKESVVREGDIEAIEEETLFTSTVAQEYFKDSYDQPRGVIVKYTHSGLTHDGDLVFNFKIIEDGSNAIETITKEVTIEGIDLGKAKTYLETLIPKNYTSDTDIPTTDSSGTLEGEIVNKFFDFSGDQSYHAPANVSIAYQVSPLENNRYTVTFTITKNQQSSREVTLTINYFIGDIVITSAASYLSGLHEKTLTKTEGIESISERAFGDSEAQMYFEDDYIPPKDVTITYWHDGLTEDGNLVLNIKIEKDEQSLTLTFNILVVGIDSHKAKKNLENLFTPKTLTKTAIIPPLTYETTFNADEAAKYFTFTRTYTEPNGVTITYSHNGLTHDGNLVLNFKIKKENQETLTISFNIPVVGINQGKTETYLEGLTQKQFKSEDELSFSKSGTLDSTNVNQFFLFNQGMPYSVPDNVSIAYRMGDVNNNKFSVLFTITTNDSTTMQQLTVPRSYTIIDDEDIYNAYNYLSSLDIVSFLTINSELESTDDNPLVFDNNGNFHIFTSYQAPDNVTIKYSYPAITEDGDLIVTFHIIKESITTTLTKTVSIKGINVANTKTLFDNFPDEIEHTTDIDAIASWIKIDDSLFTNIIKINKPDFPPNVNIQYQIPESLTENGYLTIKFRIKKEDELESSWKIITYVVQVKGINSRKAKAYLEGLTPKVLIKTAEISRLDEANFDEIAAREYFDDYIPPVGVTITYSYGALTEDGKLSLYFNIKGELYTRARAKFDVIGIDLGKAKTYLEGLTKKQYQSDDPLPTPIQGTLDSTNANQFFDFSNDEPYSAPRNVNIQYSVSEVENSQFTVTFTISKSGQQSLILDLTYNIGV